MMSENIFLKIINKEMDADIVFEDEHCVAFRDVSPQAPTHILLIPRKEIRTHADLTSEDHAVMGHLHMVAMRLAKDLGLESYRLVLNCGEEAGQSVPHLHLHLLAGRKLTWPPG